MATKLEQIAKLAEKEPKMTFTSLAHLIDQDFLTRSFRKLRQWMKAGVIDGDQMFKPETGVSQGNIISPLLCNVYLHEVLDTWLEEIRPMLEGEMFFVRFADDFVIGFEYREDAEKVYRTLPKRFSKFGLSIHPEKTRLVNFKPVDKGQGRTFDFLGFTHFWAKSKRGFWVVKRKTRRGKVNQTFRSLYDYCKANRHLRIREQWLDLCMKIRGYYAYFAIPGNFIFLKQIRHRTISYWFKWLNRRSQYNSYTWKSFEKLLKVFPLPYPRIIHKNV